jgi:hypothetical protein
MEKLFLSGKGGKKMIRTKKIKSISSQLPSDTACVNFINVLTWHDATKENGSPYHVFSPYFLKTDGQEEQHNAGGVLFENFWQGSKLWPVYYDCEIWAHPTLRGKNPKHLWYKYKCANDRGREDHLLSDEIQPEYYVWRQSIFSCPHPLRYPNGFSRKSEVAFSLLIDKDGRERRLNYLEARQKIYIQEYNRLVKKLPEYQKLKDLLIQHDKTLVICEIDVPDNETMTLEKLEKLAADERQPFGHGLCLAWELLKEIKKNSGF